MKKKLFGLIMIAIMFAFPFFVSAAEVEKVGTEDALRTAVESGKSVQLVDDIELSETITITKSNITFDLNGRTLSYESSVAGEAMITNKGSLTITDSTNTALGKILFEYIGEPDTSYGKGNYTISNVGTLVIEKGTIENATAKMSHACYAIDNNSINSASSLTVNGGTVVNTYNYAIRQIAGSNQNVLTINNGIVTGTRAVWVQLAGSDTTVKPNVTLNVIGGKLIGTGESADYKLAVYSYSYGNSLENVKINVSGGILEGDLALSGGKNKTISELVNITGGKISAVYSYAAAENTRISISGGTFEATPEEYLPNETEEETKVYEVIDSETGDVKYVVATEDDLEEDIYEESSMTAKEFGEELKNFKESLKEFEEEINELEGEEKEAALEEFEIYQKFITDLEKALAGKTTISVHDLYYVSFIGSDVVGGSNVSELDKAVKVTLNVPEKLEKVKEGYTRKYSVIRLHLNSEGEFEVEVLPGTLNKDGVVEFETDKFSTYILTYEDVKDTSNPKTFDGISSIMIVAFVSLISLLAVALYAKNKKVFN